MCDSPRSWAINTSNIARFSLKFWVHCASFACLSYLGPTCLFRGQLLCILSCLSLVCGYYMTTALFKSVHNFLKNECSSIADRQTNEQRGKRKEPNTLPINSLLTHSLRQHKVRLRSHRHECEYESESGFSFRLSLVQASPGAARSRSLVQARNSTAQKLLVGMKFTCNPHLLVQNSYCLLYTSPSPRD